MKGKGAYMSQTNELSKQQKKSKETKERLEILNKSNDGFFIASEDLRLRGPGDLFGIRQSGTMDFRLADVFQDSQLLKQASELATDILEKDPNLEDIEWYHLKKALERTLSDMELEKTL